MDQCINVSMDQWINTPKVIVQVDQCTNGSIYQRINVKRDQCIKSSMNQWINNPIDQFAIGSINSWINKSKYQWIQL